MIIQIRGWEFPIISYYAGVIYFLNMFYKTLDMFYKTSHIFYKTLKALSFLFSSYLDIYYLTQAKIPIFEYTHSNIGRIRV